MKWCRICIGWSLAMWGELSAKLGRRRWVFFGAFGLLLFGIWWVGGPVVRLSEGANPWGTFGNFLAAALEPTWRDENPIIPNGSVSFGWRLWGDFGRTIRYALVAMTLAVPMGMLLGLLSSRMGFRGGRVVVRVVIALMRSVHELLWVILFLSAIGNEPLVACVALAVPFAGTLAKVFGELIDEVDQRAEKALRAAGGGGMSSFFMGGLPIVLPDFFSYSLYRFECALRSSVVLGFIGIETLGLTLRRSFENGYFREVWMALYVLLGLVFLVEGLGAFLRKRSRRGGVSQWSTDKQKGDFAEQQRMLWLRAPRDWWVRGVGGMLALSGLGAWFFGERLWSGKPVEQRLERWGRFVEKVTPEPLREGSGSVESLGDWGWNLWASKGGEALAQTVWMAVVAVLLAGVIAFAVLPWSNRILGTCTPLGIGMCRGWSRRFLAGGLRFLFMGLRAIPEYMYAFFLLAFLGPSMWPLIFALALHNGGILGRLWGEVIENGGGEMAGQQVLGRGGGRLAVFGIVLMPDSLNRFLLFLFYRWETCLREATVLGMLSVTSLGFHISIARNYFRYDEMLFFVFLGASVVVIADLISDELRRRLR